MTIQSLSSCQILPEKAEADPGNEEEGSHTVHCSVVGIAHAQPSMSVKQYV